MRPALDRASPPRSVRHDAARSRRRGAAAVLLTCLAAACGADAAPTWSRDVAAIVHANCSGCHRPGESAPFDLLTYDDAFRKRRQIVQMTGRRLMPPWLPTHGDFVDSRRLDDATVQLLADWVDAGAPRGDAASAPAPPQFPSGWQLREPDLVVTAPEAFLMPAAGPDLFRNLVIPIDLESVRHVEAVEIRPGSPAVHHAILQVDGTRDSRRRAALDPAPGFPGMAMGLSQPPDGHFIGWTPGKMPHRNPPGFAWRLWPGNDLVLQLHLTPTGRAETVRPQIGLYFTDARTTAHPYPLVMRCEQLDIAAGDDDFAARDHFTLPVPVEVHAVYPHAHYLCTTMRVAATLPDGSERVLFATDRWDFDWQDDYRYVSPPTLPAGTRLDLEYHYDNSAGNPANPSSPPRRVTFGLESTDEMATVTLTVLAVDPAQRGALVLAASQREVERNPADVNNWLNLAAALRDAGDARRGALAARRALDLDATCAAAHRELGLCHIADGDAPAAEEALRAALHLDPDESTACMHLGEILGRSGRTREAVALFTRAVAVHPNHAILRNNLATALFIDEQLESAAEHYAQATRLDPDYFNAWFNRGRVLTALDRPDEARAALERARSLQPDHPGLAEALRAVTRR